MGSYLRGQLGWSGLLVWGCLSYGHSTPYRVHADEPQQPAEANELSAARLAIIEAGEYLRSGEHGIGGTRVPVFYECSPNRYRIEEALGKSVDLEFINTEMAQVLSFLSERYQIPIRPDEAALTESGIGLDTQFNLVVAGNTLRDALELLLTPLDLDFSIRQDVLHITTRVAAEQHLESRLYDLRRLPAEFLPEVLAKVLRGSVRPDTWRLPTPPSGSHVVPSFFPVPGSCERVSATDTSQAAPGEAAATTPILGTIEALPGGLLISHNLRTHRELEAVLNQLALFLAFDPVHVAQGAKVTEPAVVFDLERAARQILHLQAVARPLEIELMQLRDRQLQLNRRMTEQRERSQAEIANWEETYRQTLKSLEQARAEIARLKAQLANE